MADDRSPHRLRLLVGVALLAGLALGVGPSLAAGQTPGGEPGPTATQVTGCTTITEPGRYVVVADIDGGDRAPCIRIVGTDSVVLEGDGFTLGGARVGLEVRDSRDVAVRNLSLDGAALNGIGVWDSEAVDIRGNTVSGTGTAARWSNNSIHVWRSTDVDVRDNTVVDSRGHSDGIHVGRSSDVSIVGNEVTDATMRSVAVLQSTAVRIDGNTLTNPGTQGRGIGMHDVVDVTVTGNAIADARYGVEPKRNSTSVVIRDNDITNTTLCAIEAEGSPEGRVTDVLIEDNRMERTGPMGVWVNTSNVVIRNNTVTNAPGLGMYVRGVDHGVEIYGNTFDGAGSTAIQVNDTHGGLSISDNEFRRLKTGILLLNSDGVRIEGNRFVDVVREVVGADGSESPGEAATDARTVGPGQRGLGVGVALAALLVLVAVRRRLSR